ncbi:hypothetical protein Tco_0989666 [Tanacetum coccineum]|uniref:Retrovirus-related Pol polyprotein from transposon TNT 1-94-like beta-barrel domain-containing protein n=1 Tax=Tanacetum coccineum TaxID=301880 RepID=A0ABQ5EVU1_9ASTR
MLLLAKAITQNFSNPTNNRLRASSNTRNQAVVQGDRVNIQSKNSGNVGRNNRRAYVQEEVVEGMNATNETANPRVRDSKYFMEQMLLAKHDEAGVILTDEQNDFLFADVSKMEEIEELSANICLMAKIQPADQNSDDEPSYESAFVSEVQSSSINENDEQMYPIHSKIINSTIDDDQIDSNIQFDSVKGNVNSGSIEKDTYVYDQCALETLARNAYAKAAKQQRFAQKVQQQNMNLTSQIEMYKERNRVLENITKDNNYQKEFLEADERAKRIQKQADSKLNVVSNKENVIDVAVANASKAKTLLCVSCMQSVLIPCHDKCVAKHKLNVRSNARRTFSVNSRIPKSSETTFVAPKTRFSEKATQSKTLDTTSVASKSKIDEASASKARDKVSSEFKKKKRNMRDKPLSPFMLNKIRTSSLWQKWFESQPNVMWTPVNTKPHAHTNPSNTKPLVVQIVLWVVDSGCSKHMTRNRSLLRNFVEKFMGTVRFRNDNFAAITGYGDYIHGNITICHVYYVEGLGHNLFSVGQFCDGDLEVAFRSKTCYVRNLEGDDLLTGGRDSNLYTISISDMVASSPICLMSKATSTKSWL